MTDQHPDLTSLLRGELGNAEAVAAADHARGCSQCRTLLVEEALGHGLLTRAGRILGTAGSTVPTEPPPFPAELARELARPSHRLRTVLLSAAVVALVALGAGVGFRVLGSEDDARRPAAAPERTATLEPVDGSATGRVSMGTSHAITQMRMTTRSLPSAPRGEFYYAWLLDPRTNKMLPLGQVTPGHTATFEIPESLVESYSAIDVSLESDDGDPGHSVTSVLRATYADPARTTS